MPKKILNSVLDTVEHAVDRAEREMDGVMQPVRRSVFGRFPIVFTLLTTFGVVATFLGLEQIIVQIPFLYERPLLVLSIGIGSLAATGTLYKKLG